MAESASKTKPIPEHEIKQNSGASATMALQAAQKAWELRQAANAAGDPNAREEILAKAVNKEIEAESFGKAAKYTRSGAFQGLAAGAGLGVMPGVTLGKITGALVGGVVATVTGLLGGGIGSVYGAIHGPFWDLGEMASHGVRSIVGEFPNWTSTPAQKKALEKMVMQARETQAPTKEELEEMKRDAPDDMPDTWAQRTKDMTSWRPSIPSMPAMPSVPSMPTSAALGLGGLSSSIASWGGGAKNQDQTQAATQHQSSQQEKPVKETHKLQDAPKPKEAPTPKEMPKLDETPRKEVQQNITRSQSSSKAQSSPQVKPASKPQASSRPKASRLEEPTAQPKSSATQAREPATTNKNATLANAQKAPPSETKEQKPSPATDGTRKKPRKLASRTQDAKPNDTTPPRKAPRKLETRKAVAA